MTDTGISKKLPWAFLVGIIVALYSTFVIQNLWNWFAVPAFHVPNLSFWQMYGIVLLVKILWDQENSKSDDPRWDIALDVLDACVPEEKRDWVQDRLKSHEQGIWVRVAINTFGKVFGYTATLGIGWGVHEFLV